jgi:TRAP-type C4-dicarboxylate transport system substrate-binding protein
MRRLFVQFIIAAALLLPAAAGAEPIKLTLSFFSSNRSMSYLAAIKPFVDAVNAEGKGLIDIEVSFSGALGKDIAQQPQLVLDGTVDIAFVVPGYTLDKFPDNTIVELPGLFRDMREATLTYTDLIAHNALNGYQDFFVIGAYVPEAETIHGRVAINSIDDLKGKKIRVNNASEFAALEKLGAVPVQMAINDVANAISSGKLDAAAVPITPLSDYGIIRVATHHYLLGTNGAPLALLMNKKRFETLPKAAQDIIRKYSGDWAAMRFIQIYGASDTEVMARLQAEPQRSVVLPSQQDLEIAHVAFKSVVAEWAAKSPHNRELLGLAEASIAKLRKAE